MDDPNLRAIDYRVKLWLLIVSLLTIALLATAALRENLFADWHRLRGQYGEILAGKASDDRGRAALRDFEVRIAQNYLPDLDAVDRCITCHAGVEDPRMQDEPQPFTTHPGRYLQIHDAGKFGCTSCHMGQGRATETADAHGHVEDWDSPMLDTAFVKSSCTTCHAAADLYGDDGLIARADARPDTPSRLLLEEGRRLATSRGCFGCHVLNEKGGAIGPDLTREGEKTRHGFVFSHLGRDEPRTVPHWLRKHFLDPGAVSPGSLMPAVPSAAAAEALTAYMLSLRSRRGGAYFYEAAGGDSVQQGEEGSALYARYCSACHGKDGRKGQVPGIRTPSLNNPDSLAVASDDYYRLIIANGRSGSQMPAWGEGHGNLTRAEIDRIVVHMRSWEQAGPPLADLSAARGDAGRGRSYYTGLCAGCHGLAGEGGIGTALRTPMTLAVADDRFLAEAIVNGRPGTAMAAWRHLSADAVNDILAYIRSWQPTAASFEDVAAGLAAVPAEENARIGKYLYTRNCVSCHGPEGRGGIGPSLTSPDFLGVVDDRYLYRAIVGGRAATAMPAWRGLGAPDVGAIIAYLRSFQTGPPLELDASVAPGDYAVGEVYYRVSCSGCHGERGIGGTGPRLGSPSFLGSVSDAMLFHWIAYGRAGSPMKGFLRAEQGLTQLTRGQIADVIAYLRHLGTQDDLPILRTGVGDPTVGTAIFRGSCAACHGGDGEGASASQLNNPAFLRTASDGFLAATIVLGRPGTAMQPMVHGEEGLGQIALANVPDVIAFLRLWDYPQTWRKPRRVPEMSAWAIGAGAEKYAGFCAGCHGPNGKGARDGPGYYAPALNNPEFLEAASDGFLLATTARGRSGTPMRGFGKGSGGIAALDAADLGQIVSFIRSWQPLDGSSNGGGKTNEEN